MAAITASLMAIAAVAQTAMSVKSAMDAKEAGKIQASNIKAEQRNAELTNAENLKRERIRSARAMGTIRAKLAQTGSDTSQGTPLAILGENAANIELGFQDAARTAGMQSASMAHAAASARYQGNQAFKGGILSAGGQLLTSTAKGFNHYSDGVYSGKYKDTFNLYPVRKPNA
jgi:hypothetical protein